VTLIVLQEDLESEEVKVSIKRVNCSPVTKQFGAHCLAFTPDGTTLVVASRDGSLLLLNVGIEKLPSVKKILTMPEGMLISLQIHNLQYYENYYIPVEIVNTSNQKGVLFKK